MTIEASRRAFRSMQLWTTIFVLASSPFFFGSIDQLWVAIWTILLSTSVLFGLATPLNSAQMRVLAVFLSVCCFYAVVAAVQVTPDILPTFSDPIWRRSNELLGTGTRPRISGTAEISPIAIGHFLLLVTSFLNGFCVGTSRRNAGTLIFVARAAILVYAIYGLISLAVAPDLLLWMPKLAYRGSLTMTFVNHNTAATFVGCGVILWSCRIYFSVQSLQKSSFRLLLLSSVNQRIAFNLILRASAALTCVFALLLTNSRGGLICSSLGLLVMTGLLLAHKFRRRMGLAIGFGVFAGIGLAAWLTKMGRIGSEGIIDDGRWQVYSLSFDAIRQRPWFGAGAGTFESLFSSLRTSEFNNWGVWDYAHSTALEIAVEMGLPVAAAIVIAACASIILLARRTLKSDGRTRATLAAITGIAALTYFHSTIDFSLQIPGYLIPFEILLGCGLAIATADEVKAGRSRGSVDVVKPMPAKTAFLARTQKDPANWNCL
jgi:O-antigen ligase